MKALELFSGNGDITKAFNKVGINCESVDFNPEYKATHCLNVYELSDDFLKQYDFIWLSPDCTTYSFVSHGLHRRAGGIPVSNFAKECDINNDKFIKRLIKLDIPFIMENPRAHFRHMYFTQNLYRITVYYSTYGECYEKPTDFFSNRKELLSVFNTAHVKGKKPFVVVNNNYKDFLGRCKMPEKLIDDIVKSVRGYYEKEI